MTKTFTLWLSGLSGAGKTTLAHEVKKHIQNAIVIDGDDVRKGLSSDLTFTDESRRENIRRVSELCKILNEQGFPVIVSMISPFEEDRNKAKKCIGTGFTLCYVKCSLEKCRERDVKGLYKKVEAGQLKNFTGIHSAYEPPITPDVVVDTETSSVEECVSELLEHTKSMISHFLAS